MGSLLNSLNVVAGISRVISAFFALRRWRRDFAFWSSLEMSDILARFVEVSLDVGLVFCGVDMVGWLVTIWSCLDVLDGDGCLVMGFLLLIVMIRVMKISAW